jgi:cytochrome c553
MLNHKKLLVTVCLSATVVFAATASMQTTEPEKHEWKNLKVLPKNISEKDLDKVMDDWRDALGVRCGFCHARNEETKKTDFASDAKPEKTEAREMMRMTAKINKKYFDDDKDKNSKDMTAAITCYVCHHGNAHPENTAPPRPPRGQGAPGAPGMGGPGGDHKMPPPPPTPPAGTTTPPATTTPPGK